MLATSSISKVGLLAKMSGSAARTTPIVLKGEKLDLGKVQAKELFTTPLDL